MNKSELKRRIERDTEKLQTFDIDIKNIKELKISVRKSLGVGFLFFLTTLCIFAVPSFYFIGWYFIGMFSAYFVAFCLFMIPVLAIGRKSVKILVALKKEVFPKLETGKFLYEKLSLARNLTAIFVLMLTIICASSEGKAIDEFLPFSMMFAYMFFIMLPAVFFYIFSVTALFKYYKMNEFYSLVESIVTKEDPNAQLVFSDKNRAGEMIKRGRDMGNSANPLSLNNPLNPYRHHY